MKNFTNNILSRKFLLTLLALMVLTIVFAVTERLSGTVYGSTFGSIVIAYLAVNFGSKKYENNVQKNISERGPPTDTGS